MGSDADPESSALPDFRNVVTRYVDSRDGFRQAAELMDRPDLAEAFRQIAERRREVGRKVFGMIRKDSGPPDADGSREGEVHRWWMRLREKLSDDELRAVLAECIRGEKVLADALESALRSPALTAGQSSLLRDALAEVKAGIDHFGTALES